MKSCRRASIWTCQLNWGLLAILTLVTLPARAAQPSQAAEIDTSFGDAILEFDFSSLHIGVAEYPKGPTGTTVFYFPTKAKVAVDARGGAPGTMNTDYLRLGYESRAMDAIVFAGGSWYGLSAGTGVAEGIKEMRTNAGAWDGIAGVASGIIFDLGDRRDNTITPDAALGKAALRAARPGRFPLGAKGAGRLAMHGSYFASKGLFESPSASGQGGAYRKIGETRIAVFTVVNALGTIVDRQGNVVKCGRSDPARSCGKITELLAAEPPLEPKRVSLSGPSQNTTVTLVVTNQKMPFAELERLAIQVHTSMARAIQPFSTAMDGDVLYAATTEEITNPELDSVSLGVIASELAWDAVLSSVPAKAVNP